MSNTELSSEAQTHICQLSAQFLHLDCSKVFNKPETKFRGTTSQTWSLSRIPPLRELAEYVRKLAVLLDIFMCRVTVVFLQYSQHPDQKVIKLNHMNLPFFCRAKQSNALHCVWSDLA